MIRASIKGTPAVMLARDSRGIVAQMRRTQWNAPERKGPYMQQVRDRVHQMTSKWLDVSTPEKFLKGLEREGLVSVEWAVTVS